MIKEKEIQYTKIIKVWYCDFCDFHIQNNRGCCGVSPIMECVICGKHVCNDHRNHYNEDDFNDYDDAIVCDKCNLGFEPAWDWALDHTGRFDNIYDVAIKRMNEV